MFSKIIYHGQVWKLNVPADGEIALLLLNGYGPSIDIGYKIVFHFNAFIP